MGKDFIKQFEEAALKHYEAQEKGTSCQMNRQFDKLRKLAKLIYDAGKINNLKELLTHENINVRCYAAVYLLPVDTEIAEAELEKLAQLKGLKVGIVAGIADVTLKEWRKGNIKFDY